LQETRRSVAGLRGDGTSGGLAAAISDVARQATEERDVRLKLRLDDYESGSQLDHDNALPAEVKYNLVCIAQEALVNAAKHSGARSIEVTLTGNQGADHPLGTAGNCELCLTIQDDGIGLNHATAGPGHYGLVGMRERAHHIGAEFEVTSSPAKGTKISVRLPRPKHAAAAVSPPPTSSKKLESTR
jgi:signal transduction histidine kinase